MLAADGSDYHRVTGAPITTLVITQSSLGATLPVSWQRLIGTALGAAIGALVATYFGPHVLIFCACIFLMGLFCAAVRADRSAYRFGGVTLALVLLLPRVEPAQLVAFHRFAEVSIGIAVALTVVWPEKDTRQLERSIPMLVIRTLSMCRRNYPDVLEMFRFRMVRRGSDTCGA